MELLPAEILASAVTLTDSLAAVGAALDCRQAASVALAITYAAGTGGSSPTCRYVVEGALVDSPGAGDWVPLEEVLDQSAAAASGDLVAPSSRLVRSLDDAGSRVVIIDVRGFRWLRVRALETGAPDPYGTLTLAARGRL